MAFFKIMQKMWERDWFQISFNFFEKNFYEVKANVEKVLNEVKASVQHLSFSIFW